MRDATLWWCVVCFAVFALSTRAPHLALGIYAIALWYAVSIIVETLHRISDGDK